MLPNFLIIGSAKSGTTTLYSVLSQHPDIFLSPLKEPYFFSEFKPSGASVCSIDAYRSLFRGHTAQPLIGEASAGYLYSRTAPERIAQTLGNGVKLVAILRHPVDRAYSMYWHRRRDAEEPLSFPDAIRAEPGRIREGWQLGWHYIEMGHYRRQIENFLKFFDKARLKVLCFDDLVADPDRTFREVTDFLGVSPLEAVREEPNKNANYVIRHASVERLIRRSTEILPGSLRRAIPSRLRTSIKHGLRKVNTSRAGYEPLEPGLRAELTEQFREDIEYLVASYGPRFRPWLD